MCVLLYRSRRIVRGNHRSSTPHTIKPYMGGGLDTDFVVSNMEEQADAFVLATKKQKQQVPPPPCDVTDLQMAVAYVCLHLSLSLFCGLVFFILCCVVGL